MNYYEHHLGDYVRDTAHLSMLEDGAYRRLLDAYYIREEPLPLTMRDVFRLTRAQSKQDRDAVETVLREFFTETAEGWRHTRCDREIGRFQDKQRKARASAEARWSQRQPQSEGNANASANASANAMRTHSEGNAPRARPQTPDTSHQTPEDNSGQSEHGSTTVAPAPTDGSPPTPARPAVGQALRRAGVDLTRCSLPDPRLDELLRTGSTLDEVEAVGREAVAKRIARPVPWIVATMTGRRNEAAAIPTKAAGRRAAQREPTDTAARDAEARRLLGFAPVPPGPPTTPEAIDG